MHLSFICRTIFRPIAVLVILSTALSVCSHVLAQTIPLKTLTFNVAQKKSEYKIDPYTGLPGNHWTQMIEAADADIVAFQEFKPRSRSFTDPITGEETTEWLMYAEDYVDMLNSSAAAREESGGWTALYEGKDEWDEIAFGDTYDGPDFPSVILTRFAVIDHKYYPASRFSTDHGLIVDGTDVNLMRSATFCKLQVAIDTTICVLAVHLNPFNEPDRLREMKGLLDAATARCGGDPMLVMGDLNTLSQLDSVDQSVVNLENMGAEDGLLVTSYLTDNGLSDAYRTVYPDEVNYPGGTNYDSSINYDNLIRIDYIFASTQFIATNALVVRDGIFGHDGGTLFTTPRPYGDHFPVFSEFELSQPEPYMQFMAYIPPEATHIKGASLANDNLIKVDASGFAQTVSKDEVFSIPVDQINVGDPITGSGMFTLASEQNGTDMALFQGYAGLEFIGPHFPMKSRRNKQHYYDLLSPDQDTVVTIEVNGQQSQIDLVAGVPTTYQAGSDYGLATITRSDTPILVGHRSPSSTNKGLLDALSLYPSETQAGKTTELWGIRSKKAYVAASMDGTSVTVYADDQTSVTYLLDAGQLQKVSIGTKTKGGQGSALFVRSDKPVAAFQTNDGDGSDATVFMPWQGLATSFVLPLDSQYAAIVCPVTTEVMLTLPDQSTQVQDCIAISDYPGKAYFGASTKGVHLPAGSIINAGAPIHLIYEASSDNGERNLLGSND